MIESYHSSGIIRHEACPKCGTIDGLREHHCIPTATLAQVTENEHTNLVYRLIKDGFEIKRDLTPEEADLWHCASGAVTEAAELLTAVKALVAYRKPFDRENVIEEMGDLEFFLKRLRQLVGITRARVLQHNVNKLNKRYPQGEFSNQAAQERKDKDFEDLGRED